MTRRSFRSDSPASILITGASSGLGAALAQRYAASGTTLFLSGRNDQRLSDVADACRREGATVHETIVDVRDQAAMKAWIEACHQQVPLELVIANAGISGGTGEAALSQEEAEDRDDITVSDITGGKIDDDSPPASEPAAQVREIFDVNLRGVLNTIQPVLPLFAGQGRGHMALISSLAGFMGQPGAPSYSASKGAVRLYGEALAAYYQDTDIHISVVCPGFIKTPMTAVNPFPMPFMISADKAAGCIVSGIQRKKELIIFPYLLYGLMRLIGLLPRGIRHRILRFLPQKPRS